ncbi:MAG: acetylxylan esterase, partial [Bacteroidales bacterium]|nr:acetylxylan esterase [Bacteroidales bacterium]
NFLLLLLAGLLWPAAPSAQSLASQVLSFDTDQMFNKYLLLTVYEQYLQRDAFFYSDFSTDEARDYGNKAKQAYMELLGPLPRRTALNVELCGSHDFGAFRLEKIIYQSSPNRRVTANLYLPDQNGKHPVVLMLCGHGAQGKQMQFYQFQASLYAANGIATMVVDPPGQGERFQLIDPEGNNPARGGSGTNEHTLLLMNSLIVGESMVKDELWDNLRAIDYLHSRSDIDTSKIGCFGFSGGGTQAEYLLAFDARIKVGGIGGYFTQRRRSMEVIAPQDGCQHLPGEGLKKLEQVDFVSAFAPKPLLIINGAYDFVDRIGAEAGYRELKKLYAAYELQEQVLLYTGDDGHAFGTEKQNLVLAWFLKYLCNKEQKGETFCHTANKADYAAVVAFAGEMGLESAFSFEPIPAGQMRCTPEGNLSSYISKGELLTPARNQQIWQEQAALRADFLTLKPEVQNRQVVILAGISPAPIVRAEEIRSTKLEGLCIESFILHSENETPLPCLLLLPDKPQQDTIRIILHDQGKSKIADSCIQLCQSSGRILLLADLRGLGESRDKPERNESKYFNTEYSVGMMSLHIGKTLVGQRATDILMLESFIRQHELLKSCCAELEAYGKCAPPALHAAFLFNRLQVLRLHSEIPSWEYLLAHPMTKEQLSYIVPEASKHYDLPDLVQALTARKISVIY